MEPVSAPSEQTPRKGRKGSLENPEIVENVPGHVIPILEREFDDFDNEAEKFLPGETEETSSSASGSSRASTASARPTSRCAASSFRWAASRPTRWTCSPT